MEVITEKIRVENKLLPTLSSARREFLTKRLKTLSASITMALNQSACTMYLFNLINSDQVLRRVKLEMREQSDYAKTVKFYAKTVKNVRKLSGWGVRGDWLGESQMKIKLR